MPFSKLSGNEAGIVCVKLCNVLGPIDRSIEPAVRRRGAQQRQQ